jgi:hypothetical protein
MTITTEEAERLAERVEDEGGLSITADALRDLAAERDYLEKIAIEAAQCHARETARADKLQAENARLRVALRLAIDAVEFWAAYAPPYFQDKHDLEEDLRKLRAALGEKE